MRERIATRSSWAAVALLFVAAPVWAEPSTAPAAAPVAEPSSAPVAGPVEEPVQEPAAAPPSTTPDAPSADANGDPSGPASTTKDTLTPSSQEGRAEDPTGGAYTSPTLLFTPAAAVPAWNARAILSTEVQGPSDVHAGVRPGVGAELGLPAGFTLGAGTNWVGGDINPNTNKTDFNLGISPYFQARLHILGAKDGQGFQLGTSVTYKFVGFEGDPGEAELGLSAQYRAKKFEAGVQAVAGKDFATTSADAEAHTYLLYRVIPQLGIGAAGQARFAIVSQPGDNTYDALGGAIASLTLGRYQLAGLAGASTLGLAQGQAGALGQIFGTARF
jgi:hypothetical protein